MIPGNVPTFFVQKLPPSAAAKGASSGAVGLSAAISPGPPPSSGPLGGFEVIKNHCRDPTPRPKLWWVFSFFLCWKMFWMFWFLWFFFGTDRWNIRFSKHLYICIDMYVYYMYIYWYILILHLLIMNLGHVVELSKVQQHEVPSVIWRRWGPGPSPFLWVDATASSGIKAFPMQIASSWLRMGWVTPWIPVTSWRKTLVHVS